VEPHGHISLKWEDDLLTVIITGAFNEEGALKTVDEIKQSVKMQV
jgi:hypothetical protein